MYLKKMPETLAAFLERRIPPDPRLYGVEFEVEHATVVELPGWRPTSDGSLRDNGVEYVFDGPANYTQSVERVEALGAMLQEFATDTRFVHSTRTSVHVHANATDFTLDNFKKLARIYALVEAAAFDKWGVGRDATPYCVPLHDSDHYLHGILTSRYIEDIIHRYAGRSSKYSAFSLCRISDFGTVEFRMFRGTNDTQVILEYLEFVHMLVCGTVSDSSELDIVQQIATHFRLPLDVDEAYLGLSVMRMLENVTFNTQHTAPHRMVSVKALRGWRRYRLLSSSSWLSQEIPQPPPRRVRRAAQPTAQVTAARDDEGDLVGLSPIERGIVRDARRRGGWSGSDIDRYQRATPLSVERIVQILIVYVGDN